MASDQKGQGNNQSDKLQFALFERVLGGLILAGLIAAFAIPQATAVRTAELTLSIKNTAETLLDLKADIKELTGSFSQYTQQVNARIHSIELEQASMKGEMVRLWDAVKKGQAREPVVR